MSTNAPVTPAEAVHTDTKVRCFLVHYDGPGGRNGGPCIKCSCGEYVRPQNWDSHRGAAIVRAHATPTPASLKALAEWFDSPALSPPISLRPSGPDSPRYTPGYLLRCIADAMEGR